VAALIRAKIESLNLTGISITSFGTRLIIGGALAVSGTGAGLIGSIRDMAGNTLKPNQVDGSTTLSVFLGEGLDYGDAPAPYASTDAANGARHKVVEGLSLGSTVTADADARLPNQDSDDGVTFTGLFSAFQSNATISVTNTLGGSSFASVWVDLNGDGTFAPSERIVNGLEFVGSGSQTVSFLVDANTAVRGNTYARVRLSTDVNAVASPVGSAGNGEVEDYAIEIKTNPFTNGNLNLDVNADGRVSPIDALQVINWLNDPSKPRLLELAQATGLPPFVDVDGNGRVTPLDVLLIINHLNSRPSTGEGEEAGMAMLADDSSRFGSSHQMVLANDWAASLFNSRPESSPAHVADEFVCVYTGESLEVDFVTEQGHKPAASVDSLWADYADQNEQGPIVLDDQLLDELLS
jgi:hypothetical protein